MSHPSSLTSSTSSRGWASPTALACTALLAVLAAGCRRPPLAHIEAARQALEKASEAGGMLRAPTICAAAQATLLRAQAEIDSQARRARLSRDYTEAEALALKALGESQSCAARARAVRDALSQRAQRSLEDLKDLIARASGLVRHVPDGEGIKGGLLRADIALGEGRARFEQRQFERAEEAASRGRSEVTRAITDIDDYFDHFRASPRQITWRRWIEQTLRDSEHDGQPVIIVDKLRRQMLLIRGSEELASYPVDLGAGGIESKTRAGDDATPEGRYRVTEVRGPGRTRYYRALMLDYPNAEDQARFDSLKRAGQVPRHLGIGGLIEIHGRGGRGQDWTQGCVALENSDMDDLVSQVGVGARVTIVGTIPDGAIP